MEKKFEQTRHLLAMEKDSTGPLNINNYDIATIPFAHSPHNAMIIQAHERYEALSPFMTHPK